MAEVPQISAGDAGKSMFPAELVAVVEAAIRRAAKIEPQEHEEEICWHDCAMAALLVGDAWCRARSGNLQGFVADSAQPDAGRQQR